MSPTVSRLLLSLAAVVAAPGVYIAAFILMEYASGRLDEVSLLVADLVVAALFMVTWILIWHPVVHWTGRRTIATVWITAGSILSAVAVAVLYAMAMRHDEEVGIILAGMLWLTLWIAATALVWRETPAERTARASVAGGIDLRCPKCGYDLRGLREARCPECGVEYTLDGLFAACLERQAPLEVDEHADSHRSAVSS